MQMKNIPNMLTVFRILLIPVFYFLYGNGFYTSSLFVFLIASFTDFLDGYLARKWNVISNFGKLADPVADKLMVLTALYCLAADDRIPQFVPIAILTKECMMVAGGLFMLSHKVVVQSNIWGKAATFVFIVALALVFPWHNVESLYSIGNVLIVIATLLSIWAMLQYGYGAYRQLQKKRDQNGTLKE